MTVDEIDSVIDGIAESVDASIASPVSLDDALAIAEGVEGRIRTLAEGLREDLGE